MSNAKFKVILIDPEGSGMDYSGHRGLIVTNAKSCCANCNIIFGTINGIEIGFTPKELMPLNKEAMELKCQRKN